MFKAGITQHLYDMACLSWPAKDLDLDLSELKRMIARGEIRIADEVTVGTVYGIREIEA